jgi:hypothetical protein
MKPLVSQSELIRNGKLLVRQHGRLQTMEMASVCNDLGQIDTHREDFNAALIKLCAQFFQST